MCTGINQLSFVIAVEQCLLVNPTIVMALKTRVIIRMRFIYQFVQKIFILVKAHTPLYNLMAYYQSDSLKHLKKIR